MLATVSRKQLVLMVKSCIRYLNLDRILHPKLLIKNRSETRKILSYQVKSTGTKKFDAKAEFVTSPLNNDSGT